MAARHLRGDGPRRDLRPARRRLRPLLASTATGCVPHFEKMLYDNALLSGCTRTCGGPPAPTWPAGSRWRPPTSCSRELRHRRGRVRLRAGRRQRRRQRRARRRRVLRLDARAARRRSSARRTASSPRTTSGSPRRAPSRRAPPCSNSRRATAWWTPTRVASVRERLLAARARRPRPGRDDKVVAAWNGLAIAALAETGAYFDRPDLVQAAVDAADLLVRVHLDERGRLARTSRDGVAGANDGCAGGLRRRRRGLPRARLGDRRGRLAGLRRAAARLRAAPLHRATTARSTTPRTTPRS